MKASIKSMGRTRSFEFRVSDFEIWSSMLGISHGGEEISEGMKLKIRVGPFLLPKSRNRFFRVVVSGK